MFQVYYTRLLSHTWSLAMLIEFSVANCLSVKDRVTFSMVAAKDDSLEETNVFTTGRHRLLRSATIYGANASGKSNILTALYIASDLVLNSSKEMQAKEPLPVAPFLLSTTSQNEPSLLEVVFLHDGKLFRYGFQADWQKIHSEWLFTRAGRKEASLFEREGPGIRVNSERFREGKGLEGRTRDNALFLSVCAQFDGEIAKALLGWFQRLRMLQGFAEMGLFAETLDRIKTPAGKAKVLELIQAADLGIADLDLQQVALTPDDLPRHIPDDRKQQYLKTNPTVSKLKTLHRTYDQANNEAGIVHFDLDGFESAGTKKLIKLSGPILGVLEEGGVLVVDELDARMHPLLTKLIVSLFNSPANRANAQLIFSSHDTTLLTPELFRRDQIWLTEKDRYGATDLYSLDELTGVRKEAAFAKDYILGKFGAIPFIGNAAWLSRDEAGRG
jgi:AAA15 family ATPase/GTPase